MKERKKFEEIELQEIQLEEKESLVPIKENGESYATSMLVTIFVCDLFEMKKMVYWSQIALDLDSAQMSQTSSHKTIVVRFFI